MSAIRLQIRSIREFIWPSYKPEKHYMRGPGPAYEKRHVNPVDLG